MRPDATAAAPSNPYTLKKNLRINEIVRENRLPTIALTESGGADLPTQTDIFIPGGAGSATSPSCRLGHPARSRSVFGNSTAGGAYVPGMSDYVVMIKERAKVFLGGPPLVKMATGEDSDDESLGGAEMHARISGLADYFAVDELDAIRIGRADREPPEPSQARPRPRRCRPSTRRSTTPSSCWACPSADLRRCRSTSATSSPAWSTTATSTSSSRCTATSLVTGWADLHGYPIGILANHGVLFSEESEKAAQFIQLANQDRHAAAVPAEHHRLHGGQGVRAERHHQGRGEDDQRRVEQPRCRTSR